jgi:CelD/BcsL family acetyltransferase involved in cellulose biosynthesis
MDAGRVGMRIELISTKELGPAERAEWRRLQAAERTVASPGLSSTWAQCVGLARADARVAVMRTGAGRIQAFLPIQAGRGGAVEPLAFSLNLGGGLIGDPQLEWGAAAWLRDLRARSFQFQGVPERQTEFARAARGGVLRLSAELQGGAAAYVQKKREEGFDVLDRRGRRMAALMSAKGAPRVKLFACEGPDFNRTMYWSAGAYRRPQDEWEMAALRNAFERGEDDGFHGALFTLSIDGGLAAGAFFLVDQRNAQLAFYGENPDLEHLEPAAVLFADAIAAFAARGIDEVDLGAVEGPLPREFATRRRQRLYGMIRPAERKRFGAAFPGRARREDREWSRLGPAAA